MTSVLEAYWWREGNNLGDVLNPYLLRALSQSPVVWSDAAGRSVLLAVGSVLHVGHPGWRVWGSGCISSTSAIAEGLQLLAVRGPRTQARLHDRGYSGTWPWGDPALLMPLFEPNNSTVKYEWGIIPHYVDYRSFYFRTLREKTSAWLRLKKSRSVQIIHPCWPRSRYLEAMHSCRHIASTSLHGVILADAYGIPNVWFRMSDKIVGGSFKFLDYFESVGRADESPVAMHGGVPWQSFEQALARWRPIRWNPAPLLAAFPHPGPQWQDLEKRATDHFGSLVSAAGIPSR